MLEVGRVGVSLRQSSPQAWERSIGRSFYGVLLKPNNYAVKASFYLENLAKSERQKSSRRKQSNTDWKRDVFDFFYFTFL